MDNDLIYEPININDGLENDIDSSAIQNDAVVDDVVLEGDTPIKPTSTPIDNKYVALPIDSIAEILKSDGIQDMNRIAFEAEDGVVEYRKFSDLTDEEKVNLIKNSLEEDLSDDEVQFLNTLRSRKMSINDYEAELVKNIKAQFGNQESTPVFDIDSLTDDQVFLSDLKTRYPNLSDDELLQIRDTHVQNPEVYAKEVESLRQYYKEQQIKEEEVRVKEEEEQAARDFENYRNSVYGAINGMNNISEIELEASDKDAVFNMLTETGPDGRLKIDIALSDPQNLAKAAWFVLYGENMMNEMANYYKGLITQSRNSQRSQPRTIRVDRDIKNINREPGERVYSLDDLD